MRRRSWRSHVRLNHAATARTPKTTQTPSTYLRSSKFHQSGNLDKMVSKVDADVGDFVGGGGNLSRGIFRTYPKKASCAWVTLIELDTRIVIY